MTQTVFSEAELLASHSVEAPLIAGGVRCHGGFDAEGHYLSPRTLHRWPAIHTWQAQHREQFGLDLLDIGLETWPDAYPNVAQSRLLLANGVREPIIATLTRIGTVEGFGAFIRHSVVPELSRCFDDDVRGTAMDHLGRGLYEAHARDEAGFDAEGGHKQMWFTARDVAFEHPVTEDETERMLVRMGITVAGGGAGPTVAPPRLVPAVDGDLELLVERMIRLLMIEISAFHTFAWAEELLADGTLVAGDGEAARLVSYIRGDETPHVEYLKTVLSEIRDRTVRTTGGGRMAGGDFVGPLWDRALADSLGPRRDAFVTTFDNELAHTLGTRPGAADLLAEFHSLAA